MHVEPGCPDNLSGGGLNSYIYDTVAAIKAAGNDYDIIHSHYWLSGLAGARLAEIWKVPHVATFHTLGKIKNRAGLGDLEPGFRTDSESQVIAGCDAVIATTEREKFEIVTSYGASQGNVYCIPCGINMEKFVPLEKFLARGLCGLTAGKIGLFVGRADPVKGLDRLLDSVRRLDIPDFQLLIIGGESRNDGGILEQISLRGADINTGKVNFIGPVSHHEMVNYYNAADFCVIPSYYESFSLVALEALACGTPLLAADVGGIREVVGNTGSCLVLPDASADNLAGGMRHMLNGDSGNDIDKERLRSLVAAYSWQRIARAVSSVYNEALVQWQPKQYACCR
jgi:D-inositol-3-phosphate glycosyltransferase